MGVDFYTCHYCDETFPDCIAYVSCGCGHHFCNEKCGLPQYWVEGHGDKHHEVESCRICRDEYILDSTLLKFLLDKFSLTIQAVEKMYRDDVEERKKRK